MPLPLVSSTPTSPLEKIKYIIGVASGKGGVGKSCVAVQLALALKRAGLKVGILDADIYGPSTRRMLPEERVPRQKDNRIFPAQSHGISLLSMAHFRKENEPVAARAPIVNRIVMQFLSQVQWGDLDFLLIDFPPGTGDIQITLGQRARLTGALLVTTPQEVAIQDVRRAFLLFEQLRIPILGLIENMSYFIPEGFNTRYHPFGQGGGMRFASEAGIPYLGEIPLDPLLSHNNDFGKHINPSPYTSVFDSLAKQVQEQLQYREQLPLQNSLQITRWELKTPSHIAFYWSHGEKTTHRASALQERCLCAKCQEFPQERKIADSVCINQVIPVGNYAFQFLFSSGCSQGIYPIPTLHFMEES